MSHFCQTPLVYLEIFYGHFLLKVNDRNTRARCKIFPKLTKKDAIDAIGVLTVNF